MDTARCSIRVRAHATSGWLNNQTTFSNSIISILAETVRSSGLCLFLLNSCSPACSCVLPSPASILHVYICQLQLLMNSLITSILHVYTYIYMSATALDKQFNNFHFTRTYIYNLLYMVRCFTLRPDYMSDYRLWQPAPFCSACRSSALVFCFAMPLPSTPLLISIIEHKSESLRQFLLCRHAFMVDLYVK